MEKILIVEDDIAFGTMIQTWLRKKGFEVEKTTSVKAAIQVCEEAERGFDLVLSDLRLPDHDGIFLLQWMRKHGVQVPFIVMTSYAEIQNVVLAMKSGATDYVAKPFHPEILLDKIKEAIKTPKNRIRMQPQQIVSVPQTQILLLQTQHLASRQETRHHLQMGMYPNTWKVKARLHASFTVSFRWWPLPLCRYSFWVPAVRVRNMWQEEYTNSALEPTNLSSHSTAVPFLKRWRHQNSSVM